MRIMPVTNQNNTRTQTSFKRFIAIDKRGTLINENDIISVANGEPGTGKISYIVYSEASTNSTNTQYVYPRLVTGNYARYDNEEFPLIFKKALDNSDNSIGMRRRDENISNLPLYNMDLPQKP